MLRLCLGLYPLSWFTQTNIVPSRVSPSLSVDRWLRPALTVALRLYASDVKGDSDHRHRDTSLQQSANRPSCTASWPAACPPPRHGRFRANEPVSIAPVGSPSEPDAPRWTVPARCLGPFRTRSRSIWPMQTVPLGHPTQQLACKSTRSCQSQGP